MFFFVLWVIEIGAYLQSKVSCLGEMHGFCCIS